MHHGIHIEHLSKRYGQGDTAVLALKDVNMHVAPGEVVGLIGPSGSGKSTLLKCLGAVIDPTSGRMTLGEETILDDGGWQVRDLRALRRDKIGFVLPGALPDTVFERHRQRGPAAHAGRRAQAPARAAGAGTAHRAGRTAPRPGHAHRSCRAASSSAWPLPGAWSTARP